MTSEQISRWDLALQEAQAEIRRASWDEGVCATCGSADEPVTVETHECRACVVARHKAGVESGPER
jgi:hypothetical protein